MKNNQPFYRFTAEAGDEPSNAELLIFAAIGDWEEIGEVSAKAFAKDLAKLPSSVKRLDIHINSPGGSVFEAQAIYSRLADHRSTKHVYIDGLAASAASIVAMVGHKIYIRANANMMIHLPSGIAMGNSEEMRRMAATLDSVTEPMINVYEKRTGLDREEIRSLMEAETWFTPQQAVEKGFADEMRGVVKASAIVPIGEKRVRINGVEHDLSRFQHVPAFESATTNEPNTMPKATKPTATTTEDNEENDEKENDKATKETPKQVESPKPTPEPETQPVAATAETDFDKGMKAERERISALQKLDTPATHDIVAKAITEGKTVSDIAADCVEALKKAGAQQSRRTDASALDGIPGSEAGNGDNTFGGKIKSAVAARRNARSQQVRAVHSRN